MANKKINQLVTKSSIGTSDLFMIGDASTGQLYKKTIADLQATITGSISGSGSGGYITKFTGTTAIGNSVIYESSSKIGIGTTTPNYIFQVKPYTNLNFGIGYGDWTTVGDSIMFKAVNDSNAVTSLIFNASKIGFFIGVTEVGSIQPSGNFLVKQTTDVGYALDVAGTIRATVDVVITSDKRVKENIITIDNPLEKVCSLNGVYYNRIDIDDKSRRIGFIAQEVANVVPELASIDANENYGVNYGNVTALLVEAIKELKKEIEILKAK
jgi:hypothetical protein